VPGTSPSNHRYDDELRRQENARPGRIVLAVIFGVILAQNALTYFTLAKAEKAPGEAWIILSELWTTVLLVAIWYKANWARYVLGGACFLVSVIGAVFVPLLRNGTSSPPAYLLAGVVVYFGIFLAITYLPAIRLLTRRRY
jgi:hypothetical protein